MKEVKPTEETAVATWDAKDKHGYSLLYFLISSNDRSAITEHSSGSAAWKELKDEYEKDSSATRLTLRNRFYTTHHDPSKPVTIFIESVQSIARQLNSIGHALGKNEVEGVILLHLDPSFEPVRSSLIAWEKEATILEIVAAVKQFEANQIVVQSALQPQVKQEDMGNEAMAAQHGGGGELFDWGNTQGREGVCFRCEKHGHVAAKCVADMPPGVKAKILNHPHAFANVADDYTFLTEYDDVENVALVSFTSMDDDVSLAAILDPRSVGSEGVQVISSGRKSRVRSRRKAVHSQPEYIF
jgi:hypothetical protein